MKKLGDYLDDFTKNADSSSVDFNQKVFSKIKKEKGKKIVFYSLASLGLFLFIAFSFQFYKVGEETETVSRQEILIKVKSQLFPDNS